MKRHPSFLFRISLLSAILFFPADATRLQAEVTPTVKPGESLHVAGKRYHADPNEIAAAPQVGTETIRVEQDLRLPGYESRKGSPRARIVSQTGGENTGPSKIPKTYKVQKGETLGSVAKKFGLDVEDLKEINELKGTKIRAGKVIRLRP